MSGPIVIFVVPHLTVPTPGAGIGVPATPPVGKVPHVSTELLLLVPALELLIVKLQVTELGVTISPLHTTLTKATTLGPVLQNCSLPVPEDNQKSLGVLSLPVYTNSGVSTATPVPQLTVGLGTLTQVGFKT
jgi:hypothetical protein